MVSDGIWIYHQFFVGDECWRNGGIVFTEFIFAII